MPRVARGEDQRVYLALPPGHRVAQQAQIAEVKLALHAGLTVGDPHRGRGLAEPAPLHAEPVQRPVGHHHPAPLEQNPDLHHRQARLHLRLDLGMTSFQLVPGPPVTARANRADRTGDLADKPISQLAQAAVTGQASTDRSLDIPPGRLTIYTCLLGHLAQPRPGQPRTQHLTDLSHGNLPECHPEPPSPSTWKIAYRT